MTHKQMYCFIHQPKTLINVKNIIRKYDIMCFSLLILLYYNFFRNIIINFKSKQRMSINDFVVLAKIGEGAFSSVHKVKRISDGNIYALKKVVNFLTQVKINGLKEKEKENSLNQVRILASISSSNIIGYKEAFFDEKSSTLCIIMEFADGGDLEKVIAKKKKTLAWVPEKQIWAMARQVLTGLSVLHDMNIIHRDIKCANIFISEGVYKLGDLNVSKLLKTNLAYTQTGTPYYASPQVWDDKPYELKSDIWSLGCIVYEYCALKPPFTANSMQGLYKKVMKGVYPRIPTPYSETLQKFIKKCLQLDSKNRPTCRELLNMVPNSTLKSTTEEDQITSVNLLNTIKVPRNMKSWRDQLPKSKYENNEEQIQQQETRKNTFGHLSQQKLRDIVRQKNPDTSLIIPHANPRKKDSIKRITPELRLGAELQNYHQLVHSHVEKQQVLPKIKVHSQPNDGIYQINSLIAKAKEQERIRRYNYNRPAWWG